MSDHLVTVRIEMKISNYTRAGAVHSALSKLPKEFVEDAGVAKITRIDISVEDVEDDL